jgi:hypothetical protein
MYVVILFGSVVLACAVGYRVGIGRCLSRLPLFSQSAGQRWAETR